MSNPTTPDAPPPPGGKGGRARLGRRLAQVVYFVLLVWVIAAGAIEILSEGLFAARVPRDAPACRTELVALRARLADASLARADGLGELAAVRAFRAALGGEAGRAWDIRAQELIDGCPAAESSAAYALARLRAAHEAMVRIDAQQVASARDAHAQSVKAMAPLAAPPNPPGREQLGPPKDQSPQP